MQDTQLYQQILGLKEPWLVDRVELNLDQHQVTVFVEHRPDVAWQCPHCGQACPLYDHGPSRTWRHLDTCQFRTLLQARPPRVNCPEHGVCNATLPWAEPGARFTMLMERFVIDVLQECQNITAACRLIDIGWDQAAHVMQRAVERGMHRREQTMVKYLGVDEKRYGRGHVYVTVVSDLETGAVQDVTEHHVIESLACYYRQLSQAQLESIQAVAMDMHQSYITATQDHVPGGEHKIVFDRFHVIRQANQALESVRASEYRQLCGDDKDVLRGAKQMLLWGRENRPAKYDERFAELRRHTLRTARAWSMKELLRQLWLQPSLNHAREFLRRWSRWVSRSKIHPMKRLVRMLRRRIDGVLRYYEHPLTTAGCEGNSRIAAIQHCAAGYRNFQRLRQAILFYCGQLDLHP
ncbi:ISL3 family transposase [Planctomycetales bacterium ZRK34]|nr:ISL3 family transposase [Planctomycetales bacterium ZRK34]